MSKIPYLQERAQLTSTYLGRQDLPRPDGFNEHEDDVEFIDKALVWRGYAYYIHEVAHESCIRSVACNLRDIETFADVSGLSRGLIYRSGCLLSSDPVKLLHIVKNVLQIRSIIDIRGFMPREPESAEAFTTLQAHSISSAYKVFFFDAATQKWHSAKKNVKADGPSSGVSHSARIFSPPKVSGEPDTGYSLFRFQAEDMDPTFQMNTLGNFFYTAFSHFPWFSQWLEALKSRKAQREKIPTEHYGIRLLVSGSVFIRAILETLTWARLPLLICSFYGKDRVGIISLLILSILGATREALLTDYCASEAGLTAFAIQSLGRYNEDMIIPSSIITCRPNIVRRILRFIQRRWGSIDGYLDWIRFGEALRDKLRSRLILSPNVTKVLYKTPAASPFWTENPSVLIPAKSFFKTTAVQMFFPNESMQRVLRVASLFKLRQTFDDIANQKSPNLWVLACRRLCCLKQRRQEEKKKKASYISGGKDEDFQHLVDQCSLSDGSLAKPPMLSENIKDTKEFKRRSIMLKHDIKRLQGGMKEILLARKVVLHKLTDALLSLTRADIVKLILFRNTQIYAQRSKNLWVTTAPDLFDIYLNHPNLFAKHRIVKLQDVLKVILNYWRKTQKNKCSKRSFGDASSFQFEDISSQMKRSSINQVKKGKKFKFAYREPKYFFHELCENLSLFQDRNTELFSTTTPKTFRDWLMQNWILPGESSAISDPFHDTREECFVSPNVLAQYFRYQDDLGLCHEPLLKRDSVTRSTPCLTKAGRNPLLHRKWQRETYRIKEKQFYNYLKRFVHLQISSGPSREQTNAFRDEEMNKSTLLRKQLKPKSTWKSCSRDSTFFNIKVEKNMCPRNSRFPTEGDSRQLHRDFCVKNRDTLMQSNSFQGTLENVLSSTAFNVERDLLLSNSLGKISEKQRPRRSKVSNSNVPYNLLGRKSDRLDKRESFSSSFGSDSVWLKDSFYSSSLTSDGMSWSRDKLCRPILCRREASSESCDAKASISFDEIREACDFDSEDERDWLFQHVLQESRIHDALERAQEELTAAGRSHGRMEPFSANLRLPIQLSSLDGCDSALARWPCNAFGFIPSTYDTLIWNDSFYQAAQFTRDMGQAALMYDAARLEISSGFPFVNSSQSYTETCIGTLEVTEDAFLSTDPNIIRNHLGNTHAH